MRRSRAFQFLAATAIVATLATSLEAQTTRQDQDACTSLTPAAMGGPMPADRNLIALRWLSTSNYELTYHGQVFLLDAYFERGPRNRPTGVVPGEVDLGDLLIDVARPVFHVREDAQLVLCPLDRNEVGDDQLQAVRTQVQGVDETADMLQPPRLALSNALDDVEQVAGIQTEDGPRPGKEVGNHGGNGRHQRLSASSS